MFVNRLLEIGLLVKTLFIARFSIYMVITGISILIHPVHAQSLPDVARQVQALTQLNLDHRLTQVETSAIIMNGQFTDRLNNIESHIWKMLLGIAALMGETVLGYLMKGRAR